MDNRSWSSFNSFMHKIVHNKLLQPHYYHPGTTTTQSLIVYSCISLLLLSNVQVAQSKIGECNFEKYVTGCYSQANFICDPTTNQCKCHPQTPVLIEQRLCLERVRENGICQYNEQCDTSKGIYCLHDDFKLVNISSSVLSSSASSEEVVHSITKDLKPHPQNVSTYPRCRNIKSFKHRHKQAGVSGPLTFVSPSVIAQHQNSNNIDISKLNQNSFSICSYLPRLFWLFLLICLFGLIVLLLLIKSQFYKIGNPLQSHQNHRQYNHHRSSQLSQRQYLHNHRQDEDSLSINSDFDVPPPYEIAIRMKV